VIAYKASYSANLAVASGREPLYPGTREALDILHARPEAILGVATGKGLSGVNRLLDLHGLTGHFATLQTPDHNPSKPHPGMLLRAMAQTGALASETVMIGDTTFDMETAVAAGVAGIGVSWGYHPHEHLTEAGAVRIVHDYADLPAAIDEVLGA
jgi:phosphoglycolate phosphatase